MVQNFVLGGENRMSKTVRSPAVDELCDAVLLLRSREECYSFFQDLCTVSELISLGQRFEVAKMLTEEKTYLDIARRTGASTATISRVNRALEYGSDGYRMIFDRIKETAADQDSEK
jgi:TrpR-related protein YerC/YecD